MLRYDSLFLRNSSQPHFLNVMETHTFWSSQNRLDKQFKMITRVSCSMQPCCARWEILNLYDVLQTIIRIDYISRRWQPVPHAIDSYGMTICAAPHKRLLKFLSVLQGFMYPHMLGWFSTRPVIKRLAFAKLLSIIGSKQNFTCQELQLRTYVCQLDLYREMERFGKSSFMKIIRKIWFVFSKRRFGVNPCPALSWKVGYFNSFSSQNWEEVKGNWKRALGTWDLKFAMLLQSMLVLMSWLLRDCIFQ